MGPTYLYYKDTSINKTLSSVSNVTVVYLTTSEMRTPPLSIFLRELLDADIIMSPVRRSLRIAEKGSTTTDGSHGNYQVESLDELPYELDVRYLPNKALL